MRPSDPKVEGFHQFVHLRLIPFPFHPFPTSTWSLITPPWEPSLNPLFTGGHSGMTHTHSHWGYPAWSQLAHGVLLVRGMLPWGLMGSFTSYCCCSVAHHVWLFEIPWTVACQASLSFIISQSLLKFMSIESVMPSSHLIHCLPLLLLPSIFPSIRVFSNELALPIRWPEYWSFSFSINPYNEYSRLISFKIDCLISLLSRGLSRVFSSITVWRHQLLLPRTGSLTTQEAPLAPSSLARVHDSCFLWL